MNLFSAEKNYPAVKHLWQWYKMNKIETRDISSNLIRKRKTKWKRGSWANYPSFFNCSGTFNHKLCKKVISSQSFIFSVLHILTQCKLTSLLHPKFTNNFLVKWLLLSSKPPQLLEAFHHVEYTLFLEHIVIFFYNSLNFLWLLHCNFFLHLPSKSWSSPVICL